MKEKNYKLYDECVKITVRPWFEALKKWYFFFQNGDRSLESRVNHCRNIIERQRPDICIVCFTSKWCILITPNNYSVYIDDLLHWDNFYRFSYIEDVHHQRKFYLQKISYMEAQQYVYKMKRERLKQLDYDF